MTSRSMSKNNGLIKDVIPADAKGTTRRKSSIEESGTARRSDLGKSNVGQEQAINDGSPIKQRISGL